MIRVWCAASWADGCDRVFAVAQETMRDVRDAMGLSYTDAFHPSGRGGHGLGVVRRVSLRRRPAMTAELAWRRLPSLMKHVRPAGPAEGFVHPTRAEVFLDAFGKARKSAVHLIRKANINVPTFRWCC